METLTPFFDWILAASERASLLTVVVLTAQALLRHRVQARWRHALWLPVLIVLLIPVFPESSWSVSSITHLASTPLPKLTLIQQIAAESAPMPLAVATDTTVQAPWQQIMLITWLFGATAMALFSTVAFAQTLRRFKRSRLPVNDALQRELAVLAKEVGLRHVPQVWVAAAIRSPAVTGLLRPALLLPAHFEKSLSPHEARLVLKHELTHLKRGDLPVNALLCLLLTLHWFNPLLWLAFFKARLDREAACDAQVLDRENQAQRVAYGHTLLKVETAFTHHGLSLGFVGIFQRGAALRARIQSIAAPHHPHPLMKIVLSLSIAVLAFFGVTKASSPDPKAPQIRIQAKFVEITTGPSGGAPLPAPLDVARKAPGHIGVLTDPQFQTVIRGLTQRKGVDLLSAPSVTAKSGQQAQVEVTRQFGGKDKAGKEVTEHVGVTLTVLPKTKGDNQVELKVTPQVKEFEGFVNHKGGWKEPIFNTRKVTEKVTMTSGQTTLLEMETRTDQQIVEETDKNGRTISKETVFYHRRLFVFVTAYLVDPVTGKSLAPKRQ